MDLLFLFTVLGALYFAPWLAALARGNPRHWEVFGVNFLAGWTVIGWLIAAAWALERREI
jgi:hypothetical protein